MRRRRPFFLALLLLLCAMLQVLGGLFAATKREPPFYSAANMSDDWNTHERAAKVITRVMDLRNDIRSKEEWGDTFSVDDLNAFFIENLGPKGPFRESLPPGFHSPRVAIRGDRIFIGVKYRDGFFSTVIWLELKVWLVADQVNLAAVEVCNMRAGQLPFAAQSILDKIADVARGREDVASDRDDQGSSIDVTWFRNKNNPVGLFKFFAKQPYVTSQILTLEAKDGKLVIAGRTFQKLRQPGVNPPAP
jgi:hypothetical protein